MPRCRDCGVMTKTANLRRLSGNSYLCHRDFREECQDRAERRARGLAVEGTRRIAEAVTADQRQGSQSAPRPNTTPKGGMQEPNSETSDNLSVADVNKPPAHGAGGGNHILASGPERVRGRTDRPSCTARCGADDSAARWQQLSLALTGPRPGATAPQSLQPGECVT